MAENVEKLADDLEAALDSTDNAELRRLVESIPKVTLGDVLQVCRRRNLNRLNDAAASASSGRPLDTGSFQRREIELGLLRRLLG